MQLKKNNAKACGLHISIKMPKLQYPIETLTLNKILITKEFSYITHNSVPHSNYFHLNQKQNQPTLK